MDQDAFRNLLASSRRSEPDVKQVPATASSTRQKGMPSTPSDPAFKPRKVKKTESKYRDRAAERREGIGNDYAQVEAVLEDFEKRLTHEDKEVVEQQRKYLGGDSQHTILVKGLDMSLLEQNRARVAASTEDDEFLERAYAEATPTVETTVSSKRNRENIIRDLKAKRQNEGGSADQPAVEKSIDEDRLALETAKKAGKFRPIGFNPIGQTGEKTKKRKAKEGKEGVKKRKKVESVPQSGAQNELAKETPAVHQEHDTTEPLSQKFPRKPPAPAPLDEEFDIFAGAGDYEGFPVEEESEEEHHDAARTGVAVAIEEAVCPVSVASTQGWFDEPKSQVRHTPIVPEKSPPIAETTATEEEPQEMRLRPLESSALPSIRDFLAVDEAAEKAEKRKARKEKKKKKKNKGDDGDDD